MAWNIFKAANGTDSVRHRPYDYNKGTVTVRLLPKQQDDLEARLKVLIQERDAKINEATAARDAALAGLNADYKRRKEEINAAAHKASAEAAEAYDAAEDAILAEVTKPLSPEEFARITAKVDHVIDENGAAKALRKPLIALPGGAAS